MNQTMQTVGLSLLASIALSTLTEGAATATYIATGGLISGTINGTPFIDATWTITAEGDPAAVLSDVLVVPFAMPYYYLPVVPVLTIDDGVSAPWVATLLDESPFTWHVVSVDYSFLGPFIGANGFVLRNGGILMEGGIGINSTPGYNNLTTAGSFSGESSFYTATFSTSLGDLVVTTDGSGPGTFSIVPEPATTAPTLALIAGGLMLRRRSDRR